MQTLQHEPREKRKKRRTKKLGKDVVVDNDEDEREEKANFTNVT